MAFINYENSFDYLETSAVMKALRKQLIEEMSVKMLEGIYKESTASIKLQKISNRIPR